MRRRHYLLSTCLGLCLLVTACSDSGTEPKPANPTATALRITPQAPSLRLGGKATLDVEFVDAAGRPVTTSDAVSWSSSAPDVVSVDAAGVVTARAIGAATVEARSGSLKGSADVTVLPPAPLTGSNTPVSATIDTAGGTITAVASDGTRYTLRVPRLALRAATQITLTPLASIEQFPTAAGATAAVLFEPDGLMFTVPAELTIVTQDGFSSGSVGFSQSGSEFLLEPAQVSADTARLLIGHFSSAGTTAPTAEEVAALMPGSGSAESAARHGVTQELNRASQAGEHPDPSVIAQHLKDWFDNGVMPGLEAAEAGPRDAEDAIGEWLRWLTNVQLWADGYLEAEIAQGHVAAAAALRAAIDRLNQQCLAQNDPSRADEILHLAALAALIGADEVDPSLDLDAIYADLCVHVAIEATLPDPFVQGGTLTVRAGLAVGDHPARYDTPLDITLSSATADLSRTSGTTDASGELTAEVELRDGYAEVIIDVAAVSSANGRLRASRRVTSRARYELQLFVDGGKRAVLEPGDVAWLSLSLEKAGQGLAGASIPLSVLGGGSVDPASVVTDDAGLGASVYTAPEEGDTVRVVATFTEGGVMLVDTVTIEVIEAQTGRLRIENIYQAYGASAFARQSQFEDDSDSHDQWIATVGSLAGGYAVSASSGSAGSSGSTTHESNIVYAETDTMLVLTSSGTGLASASANRQQDAGATVSVGSDAHIVFEVLDAPVYYEVIAHGVTGGGGGSGVELSRARSLSKEFEKYWQEAPDSLVASGWIDPGLWSFDAAGSVWIGAGRNNPDGDSSASGSFSYDVVFRIMKREPKETEAP